MSPAPTWEAVKGWIVRLPRREWDAALSRAAVWCAEAVEHHATPRPADGWIELFYHIHEAYHDA